MKKQHEREDRKGKTVTLKAEATKAKQSKAKRSETKRSGSCGKGNFSTSLISIFAVERSAGNNLKKLLTCIMLAAIISVVIRRRIIPT